MVPTANGLPLCFYITIVFFNPMNQYHKPQIPQKFCPHCGRQNPTTYKYCIECGYEIPDISYISQNNNIQTRYEREQSQQPQPIIYTSTPQKKRGYGWIFIIALAIMFFTNPNEKLHFDFMKDIIHKGENKKPSYWKGIGKMVEIGLGEENVNMLLKDYIKRKDFIFFSFTELTGNNESEIVAIGLLGNIITLEDEGIIYDHFETNIDSINK